MTIECPRWQVLLPLVVQSQTQVGPEQEAGESVLVFLGVVPCSNLECQTKIILRQTTTGQPPQAGGWTVWLRETP